MNDHHSRRITDGDEWEVTTPSCNRYWRLFDGSTLRCDALEHDVAGDDSGRLVHEFTTFNAAINSCDDDPSVVVLESDPDPGRVELAAAVIEFNETRDGTTEQPLPDGEVQP